MLPPRWRATIEFRHPDLVGDDVYDALRAKDVALCIADQDDFSVPSVATASWGYLRLHRLTYEPAELGAAGGKREGVCLGGGYVFFKHDETEGSGPEAATAFARLVGG